MMLSYTWRRWYTSQFTLIFGNDSFWPGRADPGFEKLVRPSVAKTSDLYTKNGFMSFEDLKAVYGIPAKHLQQKISGEEWCILNFYPEDFVISQNVRLLLYLFFGSQTMYCLFMEETNNR